MGNMDWLRRNWPDLLIGVALVAVIAGIIATLISGGTFFPVGGNRTADTPSQTGPAVAGPNQTPPQQSDQADAPPTSSSVSATTPQTDPSSTPTVTLADPPATQPDATATQEPQTGDQDTSGGIAVLPPDGGQATSTLTTTAPPTTTSTPTPSPTTTQTTTAASSVTASSVPDAPYRVSVGAYGNIDNAQRQLETFRDAGYPVFLGTQGDLNIVLVGPYDTDAEARGVAQRIRESDLGVSDPTVYLLEEDAPTAGEAAVSASAPAAASSSSTVQPTPATQASAPQSEATVTTDGDRYLQVGAYGSRDSSVPQRERLEGLGFVVSERLESDLVKLLIGPFDAAGLANAQSRLQAAGIDSFPR